MRSEQLSLQAYSTDKVAHRYMDIYDPVLEPWITRNVKLLELGVFDGGSLLLWRDYFPLGAVTGVDIKLPPGFAPPDRVQLFQGSQGDKRFLSRVANTVASEGFDIIIDDASHYGHLSRTAFWHLFDWHLKPGGLYVIEDWGTGYWGDWPDGRRYSARKAATAHFWSHWLGRLHIKRPVYAHSYGMVGFIKELVDEQCAADLTRGSLQGVATRVSKFKQLLVTPSIVFVWKAA